MYSTCLFCSASLGTNEAIEEFAVGRRVAFDAWRGRLWAVCTRCGRWNLAPIEERWEAVEAAERLFTDTRTRVQSENIGLCRLPDGTKLVRVGKALPGELAAWRYGTQLTRRRRGMIATVAAGAATGGIIVAGMPLVAGLIVPFGVLQAGLQVYVQIEMHRRYRRVVHRIDADRSPTSGELIVRRQHLHDAVLATGDDGGISVRLPAAPSMHPWKRPASPWTPADAEPLVIAGAEAQRLLARAMSDYNTRGAKQQDVERALAAIHTAGGADAFTRQAAASGAAITRPVRWGGVRRTQSYSLRQIAGTFRGEILPVTRYRNAFEMDNRPRLEHIHALALEMALNEEAERIALQGELAALEAAWREAEEIARIADALPEGPPAGASSATAQQQE
jgi:hypothetical protein